ncbi:MAG: DegV family EDD domain-containing protein [Lachnospiraceae bacterium]|nr:DegV family EDD domain-containing protein [Lachnospiraceae bacterium]
MWKRIIRFIAGRDYELRERLFRFIILVGGVVSLIAAVETFLMMKTGMPMLLALCILLALSIGMLATFKYRKIELAALLVGLVISNVIFPIVFFTNGGVESGATVWFVLGILYFSVMFNGKKLVFLMVLNLLSYAVTYGIGYYFPETIIPMASRGAVFSDSLFSVLAVGLCGGMILKIQMRVYEAEHRVTIEQKEKLEQGRNSQNVFFANISHEIRTPINTIIGLNELILRSNPKGELKEYAQDIQLASKMLLSQVNDILDLSQMTMQKMRILPGDYRTVELFDELADLIHVRVEKKGLVFCLNMDSNLPSVLNGDAKRLRQVFLNILDNAVKYTKEGSVTLAVQGEECGDGDLLLKVKVTDTGVGIRKEDMDSIYDSFKRVDEKKNERIEGSGLGLAITRQLVELMDGEIAVDSIYTKGTVFTVTLKQKIVDVSPIGNIHFLHRKRREDEIYQPSFEAPDVRILVVDDNRMNARVAERLLQPTRVQVDIAASGEECLEMTRRKYYHVILMDGMMLGMSGPETMKCIRSQENGLCRDTAIIIMTGNTLSGARQMYLEEGFDGYIEKPIMGEVLEAEILRLLPADLIEYQESGTVETGSQIQRISMRKRKKVYITTECSCDIPAELLEKYDIQLMYLYIKTPFGRFADTREIDSDSLNQYLSGDSSSAYAERATVEEYEEFFAERLTEADSVVHIAIGSCTGQSCQMAQTAAKGFDHVHVIDSGQISCGQGMLVLYAAKMALEGKGAEEICEEIERKKGAIQSCFIMPAADIFYQNGRTRSITAKACRVFHLHPMFKLHKKKVSIVALLGGSIEDAWRQGIRWHLKRKRRICRDAVFITYIGCTVKQQKYIRKEIKRCVPFAQVIMQKASFSSACNTGLQTIGIAYFSM